jgi:preprotein translocase subunit SecG
VSTYLNIVQIIVSIVVIVVVLLQSRGSGFSATFSSDTSIYRTRRGVERTLFNATIALAVLFIVVSVASVIFAS